MAMFCLLKRRRSAKFQDQDNQGMAKHLYLAFSLILVQFVVSKAKQTSNGEAPWLVGCYRYDSDSSVEVSYHLDHARPFSCVRLCASNESFRYAAVKNGHSCFCLGQVEEKNRLNLSFCNVSCSEEMVNITCGGKNLASVYSTAVPVIVSSKIRIPSKVKANTSVLAVFEVLFRRRKREVSYLNTIALGNETADGVSVTWFLQRRLYSITGYSQNETSMEVHNRIWNTLDGNYTKTSSVFLFIIPGDYRVCVLARNLFSHQKKCAPVEVVAPITGLQLVAISVRRRILNVSSSSSSSSPSSLLVPVSKHLQLKYAITSGSKPGFLVTFGKRRHRLSTAHNISGLAALSSSCLSFFPLFSQCGKITINVTAWNDVSSESLHHSLMIHPFTAVLELENSEGRCLFMRVNTSVTLNAIVEEDEPFKCPMSFEWNFNDSSPIVITNVTSMSHVFSSIQNYLVTVTINNKYQTKRATQQVCVQDTIEGVTLLPNTSYLKVSTNQEESLFSVQLSPSADCCGEVSYQVYQNGMAFPLTAGHNSPVFRISKPGRYVVFVQASNGISNATSNKILVDVMEPISSLFIHYHFLHHSRWLTGGKQTHFVAHLTTGTNITYSWKFIGGLQEDIINTTSKKVNYTFSKNGRYEVTLTASNAITRETASVDIVISNISECKAPEVAIVGDMREVIRSQEIHLEAKLNLTCNVVNELRYVWKVTRRGDDDDGNGLRFFTYKVLIPPCTLEYGKYSIHLEVTMIDAKGIHSSSKNRRVITIKKSPLVAVISGGTERYVSKRKGTITLSASSSHDPDYPDEHKNLRFKWTCKPYGRSISCFNESRLPEIDFSKDTLTFNVDWLMADFSHEFEVSVSKQDDYQSSTAFQVLHVRGKDELYEHVLSFDCVQCAKGQINPSNSLVIKGSCLSCPWDNPQITYGWKLYEVDSFVEGTTWECPDDDQRGRATPSPRPVTPTVYTDKPLRISDSYLKFSSGSMCLDAKHMLDSSQYNKSEKSRGDKSGLGGGSGDGMGNRTLYSSVKAPLKGNGTFAIKEDDSEDSDDDDDDDEVNNDDDSLSYLPSALPTALSMTDANSVNRPIITTDTPSFDKPIKPSVLVSRRRELRHLGKQTTTGIGNQNLVLLGKFLKGGQTYLAKFDVRDLKTKQKGSASIIFRTSVSLKCGVCQITPAVGFSLQTTFRLVCSNWRSHQPIQYHVRYTTEGDSKEFFIYSGFSHDILFVLPAGDPFSDRTVEVHVTVSDGYSPSRTLRPIKVHVKPQTMAKGTSVEEVLLNETDGKNLSLLQMAGDEQRVLQFITALSISLNRLTQVKNVTSKFHLRVAIREKLLRRMQNLSFYDKYSALQTCLALQSLTSKPDEIGANNVKIASQVLYNVIENMRSKYNRTKNTLIEARQLLSQELVESATTVTSNLIEAASLAVQRQDTTENMLVMVTEATEQLIMAKLSTQVFGEHSLQVSTHNIRSEATQKRSVSKLNSSLSEFQFFMPSHLEEQLNITERCFGTMITIFQENPYFSDMRHTKVSSLSINHCNGEEIQVKNLGSDITILIPMGHGGAEKHPLNFLLKWKNRNVHVINQTGKMENQSLQLYLRPRSVLPSGFTIKFVVRTSEGNLLFRSSGEAVNLFVDQKQLRSGSLNASVELEDIAHYRLKSVKAVSFNYSLGMQWIGCFYWNKHGKHWASDGCRLEKSINKTLVCRCNHLTAFSGGFIQPPNSLHPEDLTDTDKLKNSPLTMALVISILVLYFLLLGICVKADRYDKKKLGVIFIDDTKTFDANSQSRFQLNVQTGHWFGAGTSADVYLILHDNDVVSHPVELKRIGKPLFQRSSCDVFLLSLPKNLIRNISKIHVWHDNKGEHPSWFLERITIKNVQTGERWVFECSRWLAVDEGDGKVECELFAKKNWSSGLKESFFQHSAKAFLDYHLWLSLLGRPSYSRFTRAQRLSCCLSLLLSFLCVNIAWYRPEIEVTKVLGLLDISAESIMVGVLGSLLVLPVNFLWIFFFRYSRRSLSHRVKAYPKSEHHTETTELVSSSVIDQSLETVQILSNFGAMRQLLQIGGTQVSGGNVPMSNPNESSVGYLPAHDDFTSDLPPPKGSAGLVETCDFLAALAPTRKKHDMAFDQQSTYSVYAPMTEGRGFYRSKLSLPYGFVYVAWFGCAITAAVASMITIWYGLSFGWDLSVRWFQSLVFSLLESLLLSQPVMVLAFIFYMCHKTKSSKEDEDTEEGFEDLSTSDVNNVHHGYLNPGFDGQTTKETPIDKALADRRRQRHLKYLKPPPLSQLAETREKSLKNRVLRNYVVELFVFIMFFVVTCVLAFSVAGPDVYHLNQSIRASFLRSHYFTRPENVFDAWKRMSAVLVENASAPSPLMILLPGTQSLLFGRTKIKKYYSPNVKVCHEAPAFQNSNTSTPLCYTGCHASKGLMITMELDITRAEAARQLTQFANNNCTREVSLDFAIYTPFLRAISAATLSVKSSFVGTAKCDMELISAPVLFSSTEYSYFVRFIKLLFVVLLLYLLQHEFFLVLKMAFSYFTKFWRVYQLLTIAISSACLVSYIRWSLSLYALVREVETERQSRVFYLSRQMSLSQAFLQASYSLLLFLLLVRCLYLLRPFRFIRHFGRILSASTSSLLACGDFGFILVVAFAHPGYLLFGSVHTSFKSFGDAFLLVTSFFRLEGVARYQDFAPEEQTLLLSIYFALFFIGFCVIVRGSTAAVVVRGIQCLGKRRSGLLSTVFEEFIRIKLQLSKEKTPKKSRPNSVSDFEETDEEDDFEQEDFFEEGASFPTDRVLDELDDQIEELSWRVESLFDDDPRTDSISCSNDLLSSWLEDGDEGDVEYLYEAGDDLSVYSAGSGYESDHSAMSTARGYFSSTSSFDIPDERIRREQFIRAKSGSHGYGKDHSLLTVTPNKTATKQSYSCSSERDESSSFINFSGDGCESPTCSVSQGNMCDLPGACENPNILRNIVLRDSDLREGVLRDRTVSLDGETKKDMSVGARALQRDKKPIKPKLMYGVMRGCSKKGEKAFPELANIAPRMKATTAGDSSEDATCSSSDYELRKGRSKSHSRRPKGLFRGVAVFPSQEESGISGSPLQPRIPVWEVEAGSFSSGVQSAWSQTPRLGSPEQPFEGPPGDICMNSRFGTNIVNDPVRKTPQKGQQ